MSSATPSPKWPRSSAVLRRRAASSPPRPVAAIGDGGGVVSAALHPVEGGEQIARACVDVAVRAAGLTILERTVNGGPGLVAQQDGVTVAVLTFGIAGDRITHGWTMLNPEKLRLW